MSKSHNSLVRKPEGQIPHRSPSGRWEDIKMGLEIRHEDVDSIHLAQDRVQWQALVNMVMNIWIL